MNQIYTPNFGVSATRGWCLKYVDDAGSAPSRKPKARAAFDTEREAGRVNGTIDSPVGVWVVGFLDFTKGPYTAEGHVFFMKHLGSSKYEIRDSEVGAGSRAPYRSLAEITSWFGAYSPKYLGWSTCCDGREYANEGGENMNLTTFHALYLRIANRYPRKDEEENQFNKVSVDDLVNYLVNLPEGKETDKAQEDGYKAKAGLAGKGDPKALDKLERIKAIISE